MYPKMNRGWKMDSYRHRLARYGIKTAGMSQEDIKLKHDMLSAMKKAEVKKKKESFLR